MTSKRKSPGNGYAVGYRRPPLRSQFKPGQSGNKKGRPRGSKNLGTLLEKILSEKINVREGEKIRKVSKSEAMLHGIVTSALRGDARAYGTLIALARQSGHFEEPQASTIEVRFVSPDGRWTSLDQMQDAPDQRKDPRTAAQQRLEFLLAERERLQKLI